MRILLMGNPNVGKSVVFSRLTGVHVVSANYSGTTVEYLLGNMKLGDKTVEIVDVPGAYTLDPTSEAEEVALRMLETGDIVINVVDATNLERNLYLTLQLLERNIPVIVALNLWDDVRHRGIDIQVDKLEELLRVPVVPTSALTGSGIKELVERIPEARSPIYPALDRDTRWSAVGNIVNEVQKIHHRHHRWFERLEDASVKPISGMIIAASVLALSFIAIRFIGESLIRFVFDPLFSTLWMPVLKGLSSLMEGEGFLHDIVVGKLMEGGISFTESFGVLSSGLYVPFAMVLPYIVAFYLVLGLLEDIGYLPRLAVLLDTTMHRLGLHGYAVIPTLLGLGCNVPDILATRVLESRRERFIAATLVAIAVPCASAQAMILGLVGVYGFQYLLIVYGTLVVVWIIIGMVLNKIMKGLSPELLIEIPPYRLPRIYTVAQKLGMRIRGFLVEAVPIILIAIIIVNILFFGGFFDIAARIAAPLITGIWGLPENSVTAIIVGLLRKDAALGMLATTAMTAKQMVVGSVVLTMFFPCVAAFVVLYRELGLANFFKSLAVMLTAAITVGGLLNLIM